ncbi:helical backbone metal receptor [Algoriphagus confluentis]|uniref:Helical backbone metal receptor n=1 Tax=Algoriphagus confluentis TaxID=1697556 RepID=A0ABQ6PMF7_9BACT|nr:helical backbone metal receptor [Algoriphagus confluentis]
MLFTDQLNRSIFLSDPPKRIISLVPSQTELLVDLGLEDKIIGVTKFCIHPKHLRKCKTVVGGTKNYRFEVIDSLTPDLIIGNKEENDKEGIERLAKKYPVWMSDIFSLEDNYRMIEQVGQLTSSELRAKELVHKIKTSFAKPLPKRGTCVYLIWNDPIMVAGGSTFIDTMLTVAGFENLVKQARYPQLSVEDLQNLSPEFLLLSSEPFPFKEKHLDFFRALLPNSQIKLVNGELFSWYGSRLIYSWDYFRSLGEGPFGDAISH